MRMTETQGGSLSTQAHSMGVYQGAAWTDFIQGANAAGEQTLRLTFVVTNADATLRLTSGATLGNGDVWWDDLLIVEGNYDGDYFDGNTGKAYWSGAADASTSKLWSAPPL